MFEGFDLSIQLPKFKVVAIYKLFGLLDCFSFVVTFKVKATLDMSIAP